jgi:hypothetical protein
MEASPELLAARKSATDLRQFEKVTVQFIGPDPYPDVVVSASGDNAAAAAALIKRFSEQFMPRNTPED